MTSSQRSYGQRHTPTEIRLDRNQNTLIVTFTDTTTFTIPVELLRVESPSAEVQGHAPSQKKVVGGKRNVTLNEIVPVGHYAVKLKFSDDHDSGIFTWDSLYGFGEHQANMWALYLEDLAAAGLSRDAI